MDFSIFSEIFLDCFQLPFMLQALVACFIMSLMLPYLGMHVVQRGIVFIDLALAQIASLGVALSLLLQINPLIGSFGLMLVAVLGFTFFLPKGDFKHYQEAFIGIIYVMASAGVILILSKIPHDDSDIISMLFGNILSVSVEQLQQMGLVFLTVGLLHSFFQKQFWELSLKKQRDPEKQKTEQEQKRWHFLFYLSLALVITYTIHVAGVLLVFAFLVIPAVATLLFSLPLRWGYFLSFAFSIISSVIGLLASYHFDYPTGASIILSFGLTLFITFSGFSFAKKYLL